MIALLAGLSGLVTIGSGLGAFVGPIPFFLPFASALVTLTLLFSRNVALVMRFLIGLYSLAFLAVYALACVYKAGQVPSFVDGYIPAEGAAVAASVFIALLALAHLVICHVPVMRRIIAMVNPFFESADANSVSLGGLGRITLSARALGLGLLAVIISINVFQAFLNVQFSYWSNRFYTALQDKSVTTFWVEIGFFSFLATIWISSGIFEKYVSEILKVYWRRWMSQRYIGQWLSDKVHYRLGLDRQMTDNPDQRISEDVRDFVEKSLGLYTQMFSTIINLFAFVQILWGISARFPYKIYGYDLSQIPGYLVWMALVLAIIVTVVTHYVGRPLVALQFRSQKVEADFRYNLVRVRENSEQIALLHGEETEQAGLMQRFGEVFDTTLAIIYRNLKILCVTLGYAQAGSVLPYLLLAPAYFATQDMKLGDMTQAAQAFGNVQDAVSFFITYYTSLAAFKAVVNRLTGFDLAIEQADKARDLGVKVVPSPKQETISGQDIAVQLPNGATLLDGVTFTLRKGENTLITGASGSGKTTLFRVLAGIWPFGRGNISLPADDRVMLLPQQPYFPLGSLRSVLSYPLPDTAYERADLVRALEQVGLGALAARLDEQENWSNVLSGGEKQRVAIVRAILCKPAWLFLDEATSALDEAGEAVVYQLLREMLPETTIISIGHRKSLVAWHERRLAVVSEQGGTRRLEEKPLETF